MIEKRLDDPNRAEADDPLKGCWSCLWNVTDETPSNSERFIEQNGVKLFLRCLAKYPNDTDLKVRGNIRPPNLNVKFLHFSASNSVFSAI